MNTQTLPTLADLVRASKCRKGKAHAVTSRGAYWLARYPPLIRHAGGDGIGQNADNLKMFLQLRHFRDGSVTCVVAVEGWHQNLGNYRSFARIEKLEEARTVEEVIAGLLKAKNHDYNSLYSSCFEDDLSKLLVGLGMVECEPAPDEELVAAAE